MTETFIFLSLVILNVVVIGVGGWLVMHADNRRAWRRRMRSALQVIMTAETSRTQKRAIATCARRNSSARGAWSFIASHKPATLVIAAMLSIPPLLATLFAASLHLDGYVELPASSDPVVTALLQGEQLVAPPPLPPELFITEEIQAVRQELAGASREWRQLDTEFRRRLLTVYQLMARHGYQMALLEGYRSPERQAMLARIGPNVTNAGAYQSYHQYGLAADSAFYRDGKIVISEKDPWVMEGYRMYGQFAESVGLIWGGRWRMMDFGHVELRKTGTLGHR